MMLIKRLRELTRLAGGRFTGVDQPGDRPHFVLDPGGPGEAEAELIEHPDGLRAMPVGAATASGFTAFLDGIQRSGTVLHQGPVPIVHAYAAAVVRSRRERRMETLRDGSGENPYLVEQEGVFFPFRLVPPEALPGVPLAACHDTIPCDDESIPLFPPLLHARADERINGWREMLELGLAERWCAAMPGAGWLLVDGSLTGSKRLASSPRAVGVVKSHRTRFFDGEDARVLLGLEAGERTSVFRPKTRNFTPVYSWYLRLRPPAGRDIFWGLIRVEAAATAATLDLADEISRWLLAEAAPLSLPDGRWDRLLYPIRDCETFLRSRAPGWPGS